MSHEDCRGIIGIAGSKSISPPLLPCSLAPSLVPPQNSESGEKVLHKLERFAPAPMVEPPAAGAYSSAGVYPWELATPSVWNSSFPLSTHLQVAPESQL